LIPVTIVVLKYLNGILKEYNIKINQRTIKVMIYSRQQLYPNIALDGIILETVQSFTYLGSKITNDGKSHTDTICRIAHAKQALYRKKNLFISNTVDMESEKH